MRVFPAFLGLLATALLLAPGSLAGIGGLPSPGPFVGTVDTNDVDTHRFSTHGDMDCLAIWIPKLYTVTLSYATPLDRVDLDVRGQHADGANGVATISFIANYCTAFDITVTGVRVAVESPYVVTVQSANTFGVDPGALISTSDSPCTVFPDPLDCYNYVDGRGEAITGGHICEKEDLTPGIRQC